MKLTLTNRTKTEMFDFETNYDGKPMTFTLEVEDNRLINIWYEKDNDGCQHDFMIHDIEDLEIAAGLLREVRKIRKGIK